MRFWAENNGLGNIWLWHDDTGYLMGGRALQGVGRKLNTPLLFEAHLDMRPYLSSTVLQRRCSGRGGSAGWRRGGAPAGGGGGSARETGAGARCRQFMYELYAVVCHSGNLQVEGDSCLQEQLAMAGR